MGHSQTMNGNFDKCTLYFLRLNVFHLFVLLPVLCIRQCFSSLVPFGLCFSDEIYEAFLCSKMTFVQVFLPCRM